MSATEKSRIKKGRSSARAPDAGSVSAAALPGRLGILAGEGDLPRKLAEICDAKGISCFIIVLGRSTPPDYCRGRDHMLARLGAAGEMIAALRQRDISDLVFIGAVKRPGLRELRPDLRTARFFAKIGLRAMGDNDLLSAIRAELELEGFTLYGVHEFIADLIVQKDFSGKCKPAKSQWSEITRGIEASQSLGAMDVGQAVAVQEGAVLAVEAIEGTDEMIARAGGLKRPGKGPILVKSCKPQQDRDLDMPAIGPKTVELCARMGFSGIVVQAGHTLLLEPERVVQIANQHKIFVLAVDIENGLPGAKSTHSKKANQENSDLR